MDETARLMRRLHVTVLDLLRANADEAHLDLQVVCLVPALGVTLTMLMSELGFGSEIAAAMLIAG